MTNKNYFFDSFTVNTSELRLFDADNEVAVEPQVFRVLCYLIEHRTRVVSKDELINALWGGRVVSDMALNTCIKSVRKTIGDDGRQQKYIRTLPKRGFQFITEVSAQEPSDLPQISESEKASFVTKPRWKFALLLPILLGLIWLFSNFSPTNQEHQLSASGKTSIAILNFKQSGQHDQIQFFTDGLTEELTSSLSHYRDLFVIARNSSSQFDEAEQSIQQIGKALAAQYIVDGSVRYHQEDVQISANLVNTTTGQLVWSGKFDQQQTQLYSLQNELAYQIAGQLVPEIIRADAEINLKKPPEDMDAWALYHKARSVQAVYSKDSQHEAIQWSRKALGEDPDFAAAYGVIARAKGVQFFYQWTSDEQKTLQEAIDTAEKSIRLDPNDPGAYAALGYVYRYTGDETRAIANLERAAELNPSDANIRLELAHTLDWFRYQDKALPEIEQAIKLSPRDPRLQNMYFYKAHILFHLKAFESSLEATRDMSAALTTDTWRMYYHLMRAANFAQLDQADKAKSSIIGALEINSKLSIAAMRKKFEGSKNHPDNRRFWLESLAKAGLP